MFLATGGNLGEKVAGCQDQLPQAVLARPLASRHARFDQHAESFAHHGLQERKFIGEMIVERSPVQRGPLGDILHRNQVEGLFGQQILERLKKHLPCPANPGI
jgi:hypothetical protein